VSRVLEFLREQPDDCLEGGSVSNDPHLKLFIDDVIVPILVEKISEIVNEEAALAAAA
jgi:hypothetical protein